MMLSIYNETLFTDQPVFTIGFQTEYKVLLQTMFLTMYGLH